MDKYTCPNCGKNEDITEIIAVYMYSRGKFNEFGEIESTSSDIGENLDIEPDYICNSCNTPFTSPKEA